MNANNKLIIKILVILLLSAGILLFALGSKNSLGKFGEFFDNIKNFLNVVEFKSFDTRQRIAAGGKQASKDIVVIELDERTYSAFTAQMGEWPVSRSVYADIIEYIEKDSPKAIGIDLMFINSDKFDRKNDLRLAQVLNDNDNVFTSINFDYVTPENRTPVKLPDYYKINVENFSKVNFAHNQRIVYPNCRTLIPEIMKSTANVGNINIINDMDGVLRILYPFVIYDNVYYPHLSLSMALYIYENQLAKNGLNVKIDNSSNILIANKKIPLRDDSGILLNWYKKDNYKRVSFLDVYNAANNKPSNLEKGFFKDKIIYVGATAMALYDIKSAPVDSFMPGVYLHVTFMNNLIDDNFMQKTPLIADIAICFLLCALLAVLSLRAKKQFVDISLFLLLVVAYIAFSEWVMGKYNLWLPLVYPILAIVVTFIAMYIVKYNLKVRDFEYTYKLATTDGLTELYNHRFFQEQLALQIQSSNRYGNEFSLIILDIDFFKKFNDKYGHQAGDAVLRYVAQSIKKNVRSTDIVCRYGGEEMTIILPNTSKDFAIALAQKICDKIGTSDFRINANTVVNVTISLGVATYPVDAKTQNDLIKFADTGLYIAKESGRNRVGVAQ